MFKIIKKSEYEKLKLDLELKNKENSNLVEKNLILQNEKLDLILGLKNNSINKEIKNEENDFFISEKEILLDEIEQLIVKENEIIIKKEYKTFMFSYHYYCKLDIYKRENDKLVLKKQFKEEKTGILSIKSFISDDIEKIEEQLKNYRTYEQIQDLIFNAKLKQEIENY